MDIKSILKNLDISKFKVAFLAIFDREALLDYVYAKANSAVNALLEANADTVQLIRAKLAKINDYAHELFAYCPPPWRPYAEAINHAIQAVYIATDDNNLAPNEITDIINTARQAYSAWTAE